MAKVTIEEYKERIKKRYNGNITTDKTIFGKAKDKALFTCKLHGDFITTLDSLLQSKYGCPECARISRGLVHRTSFKDYVIKARKVHNNQYSYVKIDEKYVCYICMAHGVLKQYKTDHLMGKGCKYCGWLDSAKHKHVVLEDVVDELNKIHNNRYEYIRLERRRDKNPLLIYNCPLHGEVRQDYQNHKKGKGCPGCNRGFLNAAMPNPTRLYIIYFPDLELWKLGVTMHSVKHRFNNESLPYTILLEHMFPDGKSAYAFENYMSGVLKPYKYYGEKVLNSGNTELYTQDIVEITTQHLDSVANPLK